MENVYDRDHIGSASGSEESADSRVGDACRVRGETINLHVHHIKPRSKYPELALELDNGITLCGNHHDAFEREGRKHQS